MALPSIGGEVAGQTSQRWVLHLQNVDFKLAWIHTPTRVLAHFSKIRFRFMICPPQKKIQINRILSTTRIDSGPSGHSANTLSLSCLDQVLPVPARGWSLFGYILQDI